MKDQVRIFPNIKQKYALVRTINVGKESILLWGSPNVEWHKDILEEMIEAGIEIVEALGGGWVLFDEAKEVYYVWGKSDRLGTTPIELVRELLGGNLIEEEPK